MFDFDRIYQEAVTYLGIFLVISLFAFISRGKEAFEWSKDLKISALVNFGFVKFNALFGGVFLIAFVLLEKYYPTWGIPSLSAKFWEGVPLPVTCFVLLLVYDIALYWIHRWLHSGWMWPMHAVHHSDLGLGIKEIFWLAYFKALHQYYVHANIDWDHGPFKKIIASPQYHRWHHANVKEAYDKNFASIFPFIDIIFGTYYHPHSAVNVPTGFDNSPGNDFFALMCYPFTEWYRMIKVRFEQSKTPPVSKAVEKNVQEMSN